MRIYEETRSLFFIVKKMKTLPILLKTKPLNMKKETNAEHTYILIRIILRRPGD
jgi:hypothetical protein